MYCAVMHAERQCEREILLGNNIILHQSVSPSSAGRVKNSRQSCVAFTVLKTPMVLVESTLTSHGMCANLSTHATSLGTTLALLVAAWQDLLRVAAEPCEEVQRPLRRCTSLDCRDGLSKSLQH